MPLTSQTKPGASVSSASREIAPGIWWIPECLEVNLSGVPTHLHTSPYLILGSEKTLLWDTATPTGWSGIEQALSRLLAGRRLDYIVPSHTELPHMGNLHRLLAKYPEATVVGDMRDYPFFFPAFADRMVDYPLGAEIDLGSHRFVFVEAVIKDMPSTQWGYETSQQTLFVADAFAYSHQAPIDDDERPTHSPGECTCLASELGGAPGPEQVVWITRAALYWTRFVKLELFRDSLLKLLRDRPTRIVAPAHGAVIDDPDSILWPIWDALQLSYDPDKGVKAAGVSHLAPEPAT